jgi:hypothetical protein
MTTPVPLTPVVATPPPENGLMTRVALLEAKVKLIAFVLEGMVIAFFTALIAYFFGK